MKCVLFIDQSLGRCYISFTEPEAPGEAPMTKIRPSIALSATFVLAAFVLVAAAASPLIQIAAAVVA